jgi:hypothetical protein
MSHQSPSLEQRLGLVPSLIDGQILSYFEHRRQREVDELHNAMAGRGGRINSDVVSGRVRPHQSDTLVSMTQLSEGRNTYAPRGIPSKHVKGCGSEEWVQQADLFVYMTEVTDAQGRNQNEVHVGVYGDAPDFNGCPREPRPMPWEVGKIPLVTPQPSPNVIRMWVDEAMVAAAQANSDRVLNGQGIPVTKSAWQLQQEHEEQVSASSSRNAVSHANSSWVHYTSQPQADNRPKSCFSGVWTLLAGL